MHFRRKRLSLKLHTETELLFNKKEVPPTQTDTFSKIQSKYQPCRLRFLLLVEWQSGWQFAGATPYELVRRIYSSFPRGGEVDGAQRKPVQI